jgi:hypothetical protein
LSVLQSILKLVRFNRRNWKAVLLCVLAAMIFWFFNALNKDYSANLNFPILFTYDHGQYVETKPLPENVRLNVTGLGWDLFRRSVGVTIPPLEIPLDRPSDVKKIVASTLPVLFATQLDGLEINYVLTDTVYINIEFREAKTIVLRMDSIDLHLRDDFGLAGPVSLSPDTARIEGPRSLIRAFGDTLRISPEDNEIDQAFDDIIKLRMPNPLIRCNPQTVAVHFNVEPYITLEDTLSLLVINAPRRIRTYVQSSGVHATFRGLENQMKSLSGDSLRAILDLKGIGRGKKKILPALQGLPDGVQLLEMDSVSIEF